MNTKMMQMKGLLRHTADRLWSGTGNSSLMCVSVMKWTRGETDGDRN